GGHRISLHPRLLDRSGDGLLLRLRPHAGRDRRLDRNDPRKAPVGDGRAARPPGNGRAQAAPRNEAQPHGARTRLACMNRLFWIVMAVIGLGLVLLMVNHSAGETFGLANDDFGQLIWMGTLAAVIGAFVLRSGRPLGT